MRLRGKSRGPSGRVPGVPKAAVGRLSLYLRRFVRDGTSKVSSRRLGESLGISDAQVRKDLAYFGQFDHAGIGYQAEQLMQAIRHILGTDHEWPVALVGIGNLGRALVGYGGFRRLGVQIRAIFDLDPKKVGLTVAGIRVESATELASRVRELGIVLGIIAVLADAAQSVADSLVAAGVRGILNFAPAPVIVPKGVSLSLVDLAIQLESLSYQVRSGTE